MLRGDAPMAQWEDLENNGDLVLDVREVAEFNSGHITDAINVPLPQLRGRIGGLPRDRKILVYCEIGQRSYYASRLLLQRGYTVRSLVGGMQTYTHTDPTLNFLC